MRNLKVDLIFFKKIIFIIQNNINYVHSDIEKQAILIIQCLDLETTS